MRYKRTYNQTDTRHSDQISRSARRDGATKNTSFAIYIIISRNLTSEQLGGPLAESFCTHRQRHNMMPFYSRD